MQILVRTVHAVQQNGEISRDGFGRARCCATTGALVGVAQCLVRRWIHVTHHPGWLLEEFTIFYMMVLPRLQSSIHVLLFSPVAGTSSTTAVACSILVLLVLTHLARCSHHCPQSSEKCTVDASVAHEMQLEICTFFPTSLLYFQHVQRSKFFARVDFLEPSSTHTCECSRAGREYRSRRESRLPGDSVPALHN